MLVPSANTITAGSPPRLRTIETPSSTKRDIATDWLTFHPGRAPGQVRPGALAERVADREHGALANHELVAIDDRPLANQASLYLPAPSTSKRGA